MHVCIYGDSFHLIKNVFLYRRNYMQPTMASLKKKKKKNPQGSSGFNLEHIVADHSLTYVNPH